MWRIACSAASRTSFELPVAKSSVQALNGFPSQTGSDSRVLSAGTKQVAVNSTSAAASSFKAFAFTR
jgi:hypothetical protein